MNCRCAEINELWDDEAKVYADEHLQEVEVRASGWEVLDRCPVIRCLWFEDDPRSTEQGGGPVRLRQVEPGGGTCQAAGWREPPAVRRPAASMGFGVADDFKA